MRDKDYGMALVLTHFDPDQNLDRFYSLELTTSLFGETGLERVWGRRGTFGRRRLDWFETQDLAEASLEALVTQKLRRGYIHDAVSQELSIASNDANFINLRG